jgi:hypothetical protein
MVQQSPMKRDVRARHAQPNSYRSVKYSTADLTSPQCKTSRLSAVREFPLLQFETLGLSSARPCCASAVQDLPPLCSASPSASPVRELSVT